MLGDHEGRLRCLAVAFLAAARAAVPRGRGFFNGLLASVGLAGSAHESSECGGFARRMRRAQVALATRAPRTAPRFPGKARSGSRKEGFRPGPALGILPGLLEGTLSR
jgi:hypothetical protein